MKFGLIFGMPLPLWLGVFLFILIIFQMLTGARIIKLPFKWHKISAMVILTLVILHGIDALGIWFGWISIG